MKPEILAPAGSMEALTAALRTGANAVYVGGKKYSARNNAANFSVEELAEAVYQCHIHGAKLYLAVNTVISDDEIEGFCDYIKQTARIGVDAYIVQDLGAAAVIRGAVPEAVLHGSTQMSVHTAAGARFLRELGFERVVPARELSKDSLEKICREDIEVEVFVHGALCMSVSGQCYMSAMIGSRSANRGCCGQACRLNFSAVGKNDHAALSLKDLSLLEHCGELCETGVDSLKIEGRMKRPEYIAAAVSQLKKALDGKVPDMKLLRGIFSRSGFTDGYFSGKRQDMFGIREKEDVIAAKEIIPKIHELYRRETPMRRVDFYAVIKSGIPVEIRAESGGISAAAVGDIPESARNSPTDISAVEKQLSRLGDTVFEFGSVIVEIDDGLFVPAGRLNDLRRAVTEILTKKIAESYIPKKINRGYIPETAEKTRKNTDSELPLRTFCRTVEQASAAAEFSEFVAVPMNIISSVIEVGVPIEKLMISPPRFIIDEEKLIGSLEKIKNAGVSHLLCHTLDSAAIGKKMGFTLHGSFTMNMFNSMSAEYLRNIGFADCIASVESTISQIGGLRTELPVGVVVYGRIPLMLTRNCPIKNEVGCRKCSGSLTDRTGRKLPVACAGEYVEILNADLLYMGDRMNEIKGADFVCVLLNEEKGSQIAEILHGKKPQGNITRGLYYRGVQENI